MSSPSPKKLLGSRSRTSSVARRSPSVKTFGEEDADRDHSRNHSRGRARQHSREHSRERVRERTRERTSNPGTPVTPSTPGFLRRSSSRNSESTPKSDGTTKKEDSFVILVKKEKKEKRKKERAEPPNSKALSTDGERSPVTPSALAKEDTQGFAVSSPFRGEPGRNIDVGTQVQNVHTSVQGKSTVADLPPSISTTSDSSEANNNTLNNERTPLLRQDSQDAHSFQVILGMPMGGHQAPVTYTSPRTRHWTGTMLGDSSKPPSSLRDTRNNLASHHSFLRVPFDFVLGILCLGIPFLLPKCVDPRPTDVEGRHTSPTLALVIGASICLMAALMTGASVTFILILGWGHAICTLALLAIICSIASSVSTVVAVIKYKLGIECTCHNGSGRVRSLNCSRILMALPLIFLAWAIIAFSTTIALYSFGLSSIAPNGGPALAFLNIVRCFGTVDAVSRQFIV